MRRRATGGGSGATLAFNASLPPRPKSPRCLNPSHQRIAKPPRWSTNRNLLIAKQRLADQSGAVGMGGEHGLACPIHPGAHRECAARPARILPRGSAIHAASIAVGAGVSRPSYMAAVFNEYVAAVWRPSASHRRAMSWPSCPATTDRRLLTLTPIANRFTGALINGQPLADPIDLVPAEDAAPLVGGLIVHGFFSRCDLPGHPTPSNSG